MLKWIESRLVSKTKFDALSPEEQVGKFPTGVLKHQTDKIEYTEAYDGVIAKAQAKAGGAK